MSKSHCFCGATPIVAKGLCRSCYKKQYRKLNHARIINQERTANARNITSLRASNKKYKLTDKGRYKTAQLEARRSDHSFNIGFKDFVALLREPCYYCNELEVIPNYGYRLDRIENSMGYSLENVVPCCGPCNKIRGDRLSFIETIVAMKAVTEFRKSLHEKA